MRFRINIFLSLFILMVWHTAKAQNRGGLKVFIENAEQDEIIAATVQVMDGTKQVAGGVTDFSGFLYLPNITEGAYDVVIRHLNTIADTLPVRVKKNEIFEWRMRLELDDKRLQNPIILLSSDTEITKTTDDILRLPARGTASHFAGCCVSATPSGQPPASRKKTSAWEVDPKVNLKSGLKVFAIDENGATFFGAHVEAQLIKPDIDTFAKNEEGLSEERYNTHAVTNADGLAHIKDLPSGTYKVSVSHVSLGGVRTFNITIEPHTTYELKLETAFYTELPPLTISPGNDRREPFFDPYGQEKPRRSNIYFEMPPINK